MKRTMLFCFCWLVTGSLMSAEVKLHPKAEPFPSKFIGPYVHLDGGQILTLDGTQSHRSGDRGKTWESFPVLDAKKFVFGDRSVIRTKEGVAVCIFCNNKELSRGKWGSGSAEQWRIPVYSIRSADNGKTWSAPLPIQRDWVGALRAMVQLRSGRIVIATMAIAQAWHHVIVVYYSDDVGKSWTRTQTIDMEGSKVNDHDGAMEPKLVQLGDDSVFMLIRTTKGTFYKSLSTDGGLAWSKPVSTGIQNNNSYGELARLSDGRLILIWNRDEKFPPFGYEPDPKDWPLVPQSYSWIKRRNKLSVSMSADEGRTWTAPVVVASTNDEKFWIAYTVFFEIEPGVFWLCTQQGNVRLQIREKDLH